MIQYNDMYSIQLVNIPNEGDYRRRVTMITTFTQTEFYACKWIERLLRVSNIVMVLDQDMVYDVYVDSKLVGYCIINAI